MALMYDAPPTGGALRQGEILGPVWEHRTLYPPRELHTGYSVKVLSVLHDLVIILSPDCDLTWDHDVRFAVLGDETNTDVSGHSNTVSHVLVCDLYDRDEIRPRFATRKLWERVDGNHDGRYHRLDAAPVGEPYDVWLHQLFIDFKKSISLTTDDLYEGVLSGDIERIGILPAYHIHDLIHRFYGFLSRVAVP